MPDTNEHLRQLNAELDELRRALVKLRAQLALPSATGSYARALETVHERVNALKTIARLLQANAAELRLRLPNKVLLSSSMALQTFTPRTLSYVPAALHYSCA